MKISAVVIAHNEETHIARCLQSLLTQSRKPDEIIVVVHNCTDATSTLVDAYPVTKVVLSDDGGIVSARIAGIEAVTGDSVVCIDADSYAETHWVEELSKLLESGNILVGTWVRFYGNLFTQIVSLCNRFLCANKGRKAAPWIWGPSYAFHTKDAEFVKDILRRSQSLSQAITLTRNPEDYWLALFMSERGTLQVTNRTWVMTAEKEETNMQAWSRFWENLSNGRKIRIFLKTHTIV